VRTLHFSEHGDLDKLTYGEMPRPQVAPREVRVVTRAAALNHLDLFVLRGLPGVELRLPHILGSDGAGIAGEVGERVTRFKAGDAVMLNPLLSCGQCEYCRQGEHSLCVKVKILGEHGPGTFTEEFVAPEENLWPLPAGRSFEEAAAFSLVYQTAWRMLISRGRLRPGEDVLVHGIGSGVSIAALQIAKLTGARVFVTSSSEEKLRKARDLGADFIYNYKESEIGAEVLRETGKRGVDVVVDSVGKETWGESLKAVRRGGRVITCGATTGPNPPAAIHMIFWKQIEVLGSTMSSRSEYHAVWKLFESGSLSPVIDRVFPLSEGRAALEYLRVESKSTKK